MFKNMKIEESSKTCSVSDDLICQEKRKKK